MATAVTTIARKLAGEPLEPGEIREFIGGVAGHQVSDAQLGGFLAAAYMQGLDVSEEAALTLAMRDSGTVLSWPGLHGPVLDKHSTGGIGDLVSLVLAPLVAACGAYVPMISGRALAHTGGTLDKLESIPGFNIHLPVARFQAVVREVGCAMAGQGAELAPADRRLYAVRDATGTVASIPLIVASILSKKLAEGLTGLVLDVKTGGGAIMEDPQHAHQLARSLVATAEAAGLRCTALLTDMTQPLASSAGNALEVLEAVEFLRGDRRSPRLAEVILELSAELLLLGGLAADHARAHAMLETALDTGAAAERFARMVSLQGGPEDFVDIASGYLPVAAVVAPLNAPATGWIAEVDARAVGHCVVRLGGGRPHEAGTIEPAVGLSGLHPVGARIERGEPLLFVHAANTADWERAASSLLQAYRITPEPCSPTPVLGVRLAAGGN